MRGMQLEGDLPAPEPEPKKEEPKKEQAAARGHVYHGQSATIYLGDLEPGQWKEVSIETTTFGDAEPTFVTGLHASFPPQVGPWETFSGTGTVSPASTSNEDWFKGLLANNPEDTPDFTVRLDDRLEWWNEVTLPVLLFWGGLIAGFIWLAIYMFQRGVLTL